MPKPITRKKWPLIGSVGRKAKDGRTIKFLLADTRFSRGNEDLMELEQRINHNSSTWRRKNGLSPRTKYGLDLPIGTLHSKQLAMADKRAKRAETLMKMRKAMGR